MGIQKNYDVRQMAKERGVHLWEIADELGYADATFSRKLRHELPEAEKKKVFEIIDRVALEKCGVM